MALFRMLCHSYSIDITSCFLKYPPLNFQWDEVNFPMWSLIENEGILLYQYWKLWFIISSFTLTCFYFNLIIISDLFFLAIVHVLKRGTEEDMKLKRRKDSVGWIRSARRYRFESISWIAALIFWFYLFLTNHRPG